MVLYPNDANENGKALRLQQQYFLASASLKDCIEDWCSVNGEDFSGFADQHCFQLNDTHPSLAVAELMRLLVDEHFLNWNEGLVDYRTNHGVYQSHLAARSVGTLASTSIRIIAAALARGHL